MGHYFLDRRYNGLNVRYLAYTVPVRSISTKFVSINCERISSLTVKLYLRIGHKLEDGLGLPGVPRLESHLTILPQIENQTWEKKLILRVG